MPFTVSDHHLKATRVSFEVQGKKILAFISAIPNKVKKTFTNPKCLSNNSAPTL